MKGRGNDGTGNNESRDLWETKQEFWDLLNKQYVFGFDCCANKENTKCLFFSEDFEKEVDLNKYVCWMNPPFSKAKEMFEHFFKVINEGVAIYRCDNMETKIYQEVILKKADWIFIPKGRISYTPSYTPFNITIKDGMTRFPSALIGIGVKPPIDIDGCLLLNQKNRG